jgi:hypothetical protein
VVSKNKGVIEEVYVVVVVVVVDASACGCSLSQLGESSLDNIHLLVDHLLQKESIFRNAMQILHPEMNL